MIPSYHYWRLFYFFVLPLILKKIQAGKKPAPVSEPVKKLSLFNRISRQIRQFILELENQARQQRQAGNDTGSVWDRLVKDEELSSDFKTETEDAVFNEPGVIVPQKELQKQPAPEKAQCPVKRGRHWKKEHVSAHCRFKSNQLQNAVIWSEILSSPVALRDK